MELNDIYDQNRQRTGRVHFRGTPWHPGEFGLVACVWVYDGKGNLLLTRRAREKTFAGTWENSGGAALAGETSRQAVARELFEETGIRASEEEFEFLAESRDHCMFYDHYCLKCQTPLEELVLLPGETDQAKWATFDQVHDMIQKGQICSIIAQQFLQEESELRRRQEERSL